MSYVKKNDKVKVHYTGTLNTGEKFDSSEGRDPLEFVVGAGQMIKGFDEAVEGMELNEKKTVVLEPENAYGPVFDQLINKIERTSLPEDMNPEVGQALVATAPDGSQTQVQVTAVEADSITVDANHPLAGKELTFEIELVEISA